MRRPLHARIFLKRTVLIALTMLSLTLAAVPADAHHGASGFDPSKEITLVGTVTDFAFSNPHVQITFQVIGSRGEAASWQGELPAPNTLIRAGWNKRTLQRGDRVTITGFPAWRDQHTVWVRKIEKADGQPIPLTNGQ